MEVQSQGDVLSTNLKQNEAERKELPKKIKYLTALNIFYGNIAFVSIRIRFKDTNIQQE